MKATNNQHTTIDLETPISVETEVLKIVDELLTMIMEKRTCPEAAQLLLAIGELSLERLFGDASGPGETADAEVLAGYHMLRSMVQEGVFDAQAARAFTGLMMLIDPPPPR